MVRLLGVSGVLGERVTVTWIRVYRMICMLRGT